MRSLSTALLAVLFLSACGGSGSGVAPTAPTQPTQSTTTPATTVQRDIAYTTSPQRLLLDLYLPSGATSAPVIVYVHGAGGGKEGAGFPELTSFIFKEVERGYAVASIDYRLESLFPTPIQDCKAAIRWLRANAATYGLNPSKIGVWGQSVGGYLVSMLGVTGGVAALEDLGQGNASQSSTVSAVVTWYGASDMVGGADSLSVTLGCRPVDCPATASAASPVTYADAGDPPFMIMHGVNDASVPWSQSQRLYDVLTAAGVPATLRLAPGLGHGGAGWVPQYAKEAESFLDRYLR